MSQEPHNLEEMVARYGRALIVVDEESDGIKVMGAAGAHSVNFDGKPKPGVKRPKNDGFDPDEDETINAKGDGFVCKAHNKMVDKACPECKGGCMPMDYKYDDMAEVYEAHGFDDTMEDEYDVHGLDISDNERKVLDYFSSMDDDEFDSMFPETRDEESAEEVKWIFDTGFAFLRRAITNRRGRKRKRKYKEESDETEIKAEGPCWPGYKQVGMKMGKRGKMVPNCVPVDGKSLEDGCCPEEQEVKAAGPCWPGYKQLGMKKGKGGKMVPNCVPVDGKSHEQEVEVKAAKKRLRDPKGGLTAAGRAHFKRKEGANLKPGVKGAADTPEKMRRKGSFLTRFFTNPSGPLKDEKGRPTRLALSAAAWGEPVPSDAAAAARLAEKGRNLLKRYENTKKKEDDHEYVQVKQLGPTIGGGGGGDNPNDPDKIDKDGDGVVNDGTPDERPAKRKPTDEKLKNSYLEKRRRKHVNRELRREGITPTRGNQIHTEEFEDGDGNIRLEDQIYGRSNKEKNARSRARESFNQDEDRKRFVRNQLRKQGIKANAKKEDRDENERAARKAARKEYNRRVADGEPKKKPTPGPVPPQRKYPDGYVPGLPADRYPEPKKDTSIQDNEDRRNRGKSPYTPGKPADRYERPKTTPRQSDGSSERAEDERNQRKKPKPKPAGPPAPKAKTPGQIARETLLPED